MLNLHGSAHCVLSQFIEIEILVLYK